MIVYLIYDRKLVDALKELVLDISVYLVPRSRKSEEGVNL
jgi:hypothetical protein